MDDKQKELYKEWKKLVNMTPSQLQAFLDSDEGKEAGLSRKEAGKLGIRNGRDSARAIIKMKGKGVDSWNKNDWEWARHQVNFINRMSGNKGPLLDEKGRKTRLYLSLLIWGNDPRKHIKESFEKAAELLEKCS